MTPGRGRPSKLTPELTSALCRLLADEGLPYSRACELAGVSERTFHRWKSKGQSAQSGDFWHFWQSIQKATAQFQQKQLAVIRRASTEPSVNERTRTRTDSDGKEVQERWIEKRAPSWQPAAWLLERRFPSEYGRRAVKHEGGLPAPPPKIVINFRGRRKADPESPSLEAAPE